MRLSLPAVLSHRQKIYPKLRSFSSSSKITSKDRIIPEPTWSLKDLSLSSRDNKDKSTEGKQCHKQPFISDDELVTLSKRCLINISNMDEKELEELKQELENMMHCISIVTSYQPLQSSLIANQELKEEMMYDIPRGLSSKQSFPTRTDNIDKDVTSLRNDEGRIDEINSILDHLKSERKLVQHNAESESTSIGKSDEKWYFTTTAIQKENKSD